MSNFLNSIKITDDDKKTAISDILNTVINSPKIMSLEEVLNIEMGNGKQVQQNLSQNEIIATYSLAREIKILTVSLSRNNRKLIEYLELTVSSFNEDNLLKFISEAAKDIEITKKRTPKAKWSLQVEKIFARLDGKNPYDDIEFVKPDNTENKIQNKNEKNSRSAKILKFDLKDCDYLDK